MQLAAGLAGAALGSLVGMPGLGFSLGASIGGALFAPDVRGPTLTDLSVQVTSYGVGVPRRWGTLGGAGILIWATPKVGHETEQSAKGGPSTITTSYTCSFAVLLSEGEYLAIRKAWANSRKVCDISETASASDQAASVEFFEHFTLYPGNDTQLPDPTMEAHLGVGNVPAFHGWCYMVGTDVPLELDGNNLPSYTVELACGAEEAPSDQPIVPLEVVSITPEVFINYSVRPETEVYPHGNPILLYWSVRNAVSFNISPTPYTNGTNPNSYSTEIPQGTTYTITATSITGEVAEATITTPNLLWANDENYADMPRSEGLRDSVAAEASAWLAELDFRDGLIGWEYTGGGPTALSAVVRIEFQYTLPGNPTGFSQFDMHATGGLGPKAPDYVVYAECRRDSLPADGQVYLVWSSAGAHTVEISPSPNGASSFGRGGRVTAAPDTDYVFTFYSYATDEHTSNISATATVRTPSGVCPLLVPPAGGGCEIDIPGNDCFCIDAEGNVYPKPSTYATVSGTFKQLQKLVYSPEISITKYPVGPALRPTDPNYNNEAYWTEAAIVAGIAGTYGVHYPVIVDAVAEAGNDCAEMRSAVCDALLSDVVSDACIEAGYTAEQLDTSALDDVVHGYQRVGGKMRARDVIDPLRGVYPFDITERDRQLVAVKRGGSSLVTFGPDDLGAAEGDDALVNVVPTRAQESELPASFTLNYVSRARDYEAGTQIARRQATSSRQQAAATTALVLEDQEAANAAHMNLWDPWAGRVTVAWSSTRKFSRYLPTDVVTLDDGRVVRLVRITEKSLQGPVIQWQGVLEHPSHYVQDAPASVLQAQLSAIHFVGPMALRLLDLPLLREADDGTVGPYAAGNGYLPSWTGGVAYRSADGGSSYAAVQDMTRKATLGTAQTMLAGFAGGNVIDAMSSVTVHLLGSATLSTITLDQLLAGGNPFALGVNGRWEVAHFRTATLVAERTWLLTGLLRGRLGTEQHMGSHAVDDTFVLLDPVKLYSLADPVSVMDLAQSWKGVSYGTAVADAGAVAFTNSGERLMPLSPVHLHATPIVGGGYAASWVRRSRFDAAWLDYVDVPLGENNESYLVEVLNGAAVVETQTVTTQVATLANAAYSGHTLRVSQLSSRVGAGHPATFEIA